MSTSLAYHRQQQQQQHSCLDAGSSHHRIDHVRKHAPFATAAHFTTAQQHTPATTTNEDRKKRVIIKLNLPVDDDLLARRLWLSCRMIEVHAATYID